MRLFRWFYFFILGIVLLSFNLSTLAAQDDIRLKHWQLVTWADDQVFIWDVENNSLLFTLEHGDEVLDASVLDDGRLLSYTRHSLSMWEIDTGRRSWIVRMPSEDTAIGKVFSLPGNRLLLSTSVNGYQMRVLQFIDATTGEWGESISGIFSFQPLPDGRFFVAIEGEVPQIWDSAMHAPLFSFQATSNTLFSGIGMLSDGRFLSRQGSDYIYIWNDGTGELVKTMTPPDPIGYLGPSPDHGFITTSYLSGITFWDAATGKRGPSINPGHDEWIMGFLSDGRVFSTDTGGRVRLWNIETGELLVAMSHDAFAPEVIELPDGRLLTYSYDGTVRLWDGQQPQPLRTLRHPQPVENATWIGENLIMTVSQDDQVRLWDVETGALIRQFSHDEAVRGAVMIPVDNQ